jgi:aspartyl-tRNA(Asn)/glutamyl-tRNA(Gln) amidotransferase subunit A
MDDPARLSALDLVAVYRERRLSPVEAVEAVAARIADVEDEANAFTTLCLDRAAEEARKAERAYAAGSARPLEGVPVGVKDLFDTEGVRTTYGSPMFAEHVPQADAVAVRRLREAGALLVGKTSTHEWAWGITTASPHFGPTPNPWAPDRVAGGSSGGSAAALALHMVPLALGSDTGGSIRIPAAYCGVVGLKPTYGCVSSAGAMPLARSLDHPGPLARTVADAALALAVLAGLDPADPATEDVPVGDPLAELGRPLAGLRVAMCPDLMLVPPVPEVEAALGAAAATLAELGAELVEAELPEAGAIYEAFAAIQRAEALHHHRSRGLYPDRAGEYGADVLGRLHAAEGVTLAEYLEAAETRRRVRAGFERLFRGADVLLTPVAAGPPVAIGSETAKHRGEERPFRDLVMPYTVPQDVGGVPACAVRGGFDALGIPVGLQVTGPRWAEALVLRVAHALHAATPEIQAPWPEAAAAPSR